MGEVKLVKPLDVLDGVKHLRAVGTLKGALTGFKNLDRLYTVKKGFPLYVAGAPHHGKSIFAKQLLINLAKSKGWRCLVYMGEEGGAVDLIGDLVEMYIEKDLRRFRDSGFENTDAMSEDEFLEGLKWVDKHFRILDPDSVVNLVDGFTLSAFQQLANSEPFDVTCLDPWNDLDADLTLHGGREDLQLADLLKSVRNASRENHRVDIIINHVAKIYADKKTDCGKRYQGPAMPSEWAGGQTWFRRAFTMLLVYRPPAGYVIDDSGVPIEEGEAWIYCQKTKPKGVGSLGMCRLWWSKTAHKFTERDELGNVFDSFGR